MGSPQVRNYAEEFLAKLERSSAGIFTIPASAPFGETLARGLIERAGTGAFALSDVTIYLPTRRAARNFGEAFARALAGAALLPESRALGDSDDDDPVRPGA